MVFASLFLFSEDAARIVDGLSMQSLGSAFTFKTKHLLKHEKMFYTHWKTMLIVQSNLYILLRH